MASLESIAQGIEDFFDKPAVQSAITTGSLSADIYAVTGKSSDAGLGAGYGAWVQSITGSLPALEKLDDKRAKLVLNQKQVQLMQGWLDTQVSSALTVNKPKPSLEIDFAPVIKPWAMKYTAPALIGVFALGWLAHWAVNR